MTSSGPATEYQRGDVVNPPWGVGIIGGGFMAGVHARAARAAGARIRGIVASSPTSSRLAAEKYGAECAYDSAEELLAAPGTDVIHVCTPNALHAEQTLAALAAGKHIVCEKPLATTVEDAARLVRAIEGTGRRGTVPFIYRFHPVVREVRALIAAHDIGEILTIDASYLQDWLLSGKVDNWRVDDQIGGPSRAFADVGSHLVDLIEFVTGDRIARLAATRRTFFAERGGRSSVDTEDAVSVSFEMSKGAIGAMLVSQVAAGRKNRPYLEIGGTRGSVSVDLERPDEFLIGGPRGMTRVHRDSAHMSRDAQRLSFLPPGHPQGHLDAFTAFVVDSYAAMNGDERDGLPTFRDGYRAAALTDAVLRSAKTGWVDTLPRDE